MEIKYIFILATLMLFCSCSEENEIIEYEETSELSVNNNKKYDIEKLFSVDGITIYSFWDRGKRVYFTKHNIQYINEHNILVGKVMTKTRKLVQTISTEEPDTLNINGLNYIKCDK